MAGWCPAKLTPPSHLAGCPTSRLCIFFHHRSRMENKISNKSGIWPYNHHPLQFGGQANIKNNNNNNNNNNNKMAEPQASVNPSKLSSTNYEAATVEELGGLQTYITGHRDSKLAVILLSDAYGYEGQKLRRLADKVAQETGFLVVVPDFFRGDPIDSGKYSDRAEWMKIHNADKGCKDAKAVVAALKNKGVSAIGVAGFCWGGMVVVKLAKFDCIQAAVVLHPGPISADDIHEIKVPTALLGAETDHLCPAEHLTNLDAILAAKPEVDNFLKIYPGVKHGWTLMYSDDDESAVKMAEEAHSGMLNWLSKYVK